MRRKRSPFQRTTLAILIATMLVVGTISPLASRPARAQFTDPVTGLNTTVKNIWDFLENILVNGAAVAVINGINFMIQRLSYDTAVFLASGGKGEGTLFDNKSFGTFLSDALLSGAGEALGTLSEQGFAGFNLCDPTAAPPSLRLSIFLGLAGSVVPPPRPRCEWNDIQKNWDEFITSVETGEALRGTLISFQPGQSELGVAFGSNIKILEVAGKKVNEAKEERKEGEGFKPLTGKILGDVKTPSQLIKAQAESLVGKGTEVSKMTNAQVGSALAAGAWGILPAALSTFTNTFASTLMNRVFKEGLFDVKTVTCPGFDLFSKNAGLATNFGVKFGAFGSVGNTECALQNPEFAGRGGRAAAQASFADFLTPRIVENQNYDAITDFTVCPEQFRTPSNCVMDSQFAAAVRQADQRLTVSDAITRGYLHGDWPLVGSGGADSAKNADPLCFSSAYCYSNLVKLRKARVIPIGWELAAANAANGSPTLKEVVSKFNDCPTEASPREKDHPYCHLIDPNWILKYPITQCKAKVYGPTLVSTESDLRAQICVDTPSCIAENAEGTCETGYGYCTREKNIWRLGGDECPAQYATCTTYSARPESTSPGTLSLLGNTVDRGICSSDNVGCRAFSLDQDPANGEGDWLQTGRVFLDRDAGTCEERDAGCSELYPRETVRENLVQNSSFETDQNNDDIPDLWTGSLTERAETLADSGATAINPSEVAALSQFVYLEDGHTYTLSAAAARLDPAAADGATFSLSFTQEDSDPVNLAGIDTTCDLAGNTLSLTINPETDTFERLGCRFTLPNDPLDDPANSLDRGTLATSGVAGGPGVWVDSIQLEEGPVFSIYHTETYVDASATFLRVPPDFLACTGDPATDSPECATYAGACREDEVGCERYTPTDGSPPIPGIISNANLCPNECIGYATYRQEPSNYDTGAFPLYFIPSSAQQCSAAVAGCSEFTNLDTLAAGGEAREYYSYIRACENPRDNAGAVYYTWEGSDTSGFQLKEWRFVAGDPLAGRAEEAVGTRPPQLVSPVYAASCTSAIYAAGTNPDCREFFDTSGNRSYRPYSRTVVVTPECHPYRITNPAVDSALVDEGLCEALDPDTNVPIGHWVPGVGDAGGQCVICARFGGEWNEGARECTYKGFPTESTVCGAAENGCRLFTGNAGRNVRVLFTDDFEIDGGGWTKEGATVSAESTIVGEHSLRVEAGTATIAKSVAPGSPSAIVSGGTYYLSFWAKGRGNLSAGFVGGTATEFANGTIALGGNWQVYNFGPVFVNRLPLADEQLVLSGFADISYVDNISLRQVDEAIAVVKNSWVTPSACDQTREGSALPQAMLGCSEYRDTEGTSFALTGFDSICRDAAVGCTAFADTRASDSPARESWNAMCVVDDFAVTPTACEVGGETVCTVGIGRRSCRYNSADEAPRITCQITEGEIVVGDSCSIDGVFICNTGLAFDQSLGRIIGSCTGIPADTVVVPEDKTRFIIENDAFRCEAAQVGCTDVGLAKQAVCTLPETAAVATDCTVGGSFACRVSANETSCRYPLPYREPYPAGTSISYESKVVQNAPRTYDRSLCTLDAVGCEEWSTSGLDGGTAFFKAPDDRICEYRENVTVGGTEIDGWFREGTDTACDPNFVVSGVTYGIRRNGDTEYQGWAGQCTAQYAGCTEFKDPNDVNPALYPQGKPYYYLKNDKLDTKTCTQVSQKNGCVLFNDTSSSLLTYSSVGTYAKSAEANYGLVNAQEGICEAQECQLFGAGGIFGEGCQVFGPVIQGSGCSVDSDCEIPSLVGSTATCNLAKDSNTILKVNQDRVCGEWLSCRSKSPVFDPQTGSFKEVCNKVGVCDAYSGSGESIQCTHWVTDRDPTVLSEEQYVNRDISSAGLEYSGYSIPHQYPIESLEQVAIGSFCTQTFITDPEAPNVGSRLPCTEQSDCGEVGTCEPEFRLVRVIGTCSADNGDGCSASGEEGACYSNKCVVSIRGAGDGDEADQPVPLKVAGPDRNDTISSCRAYPEQNSPFPGSVPTAGGSRGVLVSDWSNGEPPKPESVINGFQKARTCEKDQDCECNYNKVSYTGGSITRYFNPTANPYEGLCLGGSKDGTICATSDDCKGEPDNPESTDVGSCQRLERQDRVLGVTGYCLERDLATPLNGQQFDVGELPSRACNTWLPVDRLAGSADIYNNYAAAGFNPTGNVYACAEPEVYKIVSTSDLRCFNSSSAACDVEDYSECINEIVDAGRCPAGTIPIIGWCDLAEDDGNDPTLEDSCERAFDECPYKCIPLASVHSSDRDSFSDEDKSCLEDINKFASTRNGSQYIRIDSVPSADSDFKKLSNSRFLDCERRDVPITDTRYGFGDGLSTELYFGCRQVVQVAQAGENSKAVTGMLGNGKNEPPGGQSVFSVGLFPEEAIVPNTLLYIWGAIPPPFGLILGIPNIQKLTDFGKEAPVQVPLCKDTNGRGVLADPRSPDDPPACSGGTGESILAIEDHPVGRPYVDIRGGLRDNFSAEEQASLVCDDADPQVRGGDRERPEQQFDHCRDYGADEPLDDLPTKIQQRLGLLFTRVYHTFEYRPKETEEPADYIRAEIDLDYTDRAVELGDGGPVVTAVGDCFDASRCIEGTADTMTVNGLSTGDVVGGGGQLGVELKFYAYAANDQMPIRQIVLDWGDGTVDGPYPGSYKNHRGFRRIPGGHESLCTNTNFGTSLDACDDSSPFVYAYTYTCDTDVNGNGVCPANATNCTVADANLDGKTDCVYTPRVQVKDNWGFCNGRCPAGPAGDNCYDDKEESEVNECVADFNNPLPRQTPWTPYSGRIIVSPR